MTEEEIHKLGKALIDLGTRLSLHKGEDRSGMGILNIVSRNLEHQLDGKFIDATRWKHQCESMDRVYEELRILKENNNEQTREIIKLKKSLECNSDSYSSSEISNILAFYRNEEPNNDGYFLVDILKMSDEKLEVLHSWVQWAFPLQTPSNFNEDAPLPTDDELAIMRADPVIIENFNRFCHRFLAFLGLKESEGSCEIIPAELFETRKKLVWSEFNHNYLRVTRFLESMRLLGQHKRSAALYRCLLNLATDHRIFLSENGLDYWTKTQETHEN